MRDGQRICLVDTNLLVYGVDGRDPIKQEQAIATLEGVHDRRLGALSSQILGEFFTTATRKLPSPLTIAEAERLVLDYAHSWPIYDLTAAVVVKAMYGVRRYQLPYWDALVWATAQENGLTCILSGDFDDGALLDGVRFLNPFNPAFNVTLLGRQ